jgi:hypothetical protein
MHWTPWNYESIFDVFNNTEVAQCPIVGLGRCNFSEEMRDELVT